MFGCQGIKKNQEHANMEHVKSKGTDLQNTKTYKDSKHKEHKPNPQSLANPEHHKKSNPPYKHQTQKQTHKFQTQIREIRKQIQKF